MIFLSAIFLFFTSSIRAIDIIFLFLFFIGRTIDNHYYYFLTYFHRIYGWIMNGWEIFMDFMFHCLFILGIEWFKIIFQIILLLTFLMKLNK